MIGGRKTQGKGVRHGASACSDVQLAALVRQGQGEAFAELSARYLGLVRGKARLFEGAAARKRRTCGRRGFWGCMWPPFPSGRREGLLFPPMPACAFTTAWPALCAGTPAAGTALSTSPSPWRRTALPLPGKAGVPFGAAGGFPRSLPQDERGPFPGGAPGVKAVPGRLLREEAARQAGVSLRAYDNALYRAREKLRRP